MKRYLPPLNALRAFEAAARLGRMTAAAAELSVTPGAVSRQVQQLESQLGVQLFEGSKNKPHLSPAGKALLPALSAALDSIETAVRAVRDNRRATVDVSCFSTFTVKWLIPRLFDFNARHPDIEIRLRTAEHIASPERDRCDVAITVEQASAVRSAGLTAAASSTVLFPERLGPVLAPSLATTMRFRAARDLKGKTLLHSRTRLNAWQMWASAYGCDTPADSGPTYEHYYFTLQAAVAGLGICVAPWHLVADDVQAGRLVAPLGFCDSGYLYVAKLRPDCTHACALFCAWLAEQTQLSPLPPITAPSKLR